MVKNCHRWCWYCHHWTQRSSFAAHHYSKGETWDANKQGEVYSDNAITKFFGCTWWCYFLGGKRLSGEGGSLGISSYKFLRPGLGLLHRFLKSSRKFMYFLLQHLKRLNAGTSSVEYVRKILILGQRGGKCLNVFTEIKKTYFTFCFYSILIYLYL